MTRPQIRLAAPTDAASVLAIYEPIVHQSATSFELEPPTVDEMRQRIAKTLEYAPWLVCEREGEVIGYAYASKHRDRPAYQWAVEVSVYVDTRAHRTGVGRGLYTALFQILRLQGFYSAYAGVTLPNVASVGLHESFGFTPIGIYRNAGYKMGGWHGVGWWQLDLQPHNDAPSPLETPMIASASAEWHEALRTGEALLP